MFEGAAKDGAAVVGGSISSLRFEGASVVKVGPPTRGNEGLCTFVYVFFGFGDCETLDFYRGFSVRHRLWIL